MRDGEESTIHTKCKCNNCLLPEIGSDIISMHDRENVVGNTPLFPIVRLITSGIQGPHSAEQYRN